MYLQMKLLKYQMYMQNLYSHQSNHLQQVLHHTFWIEESTEAATIGGLLLHCHIMNIYVVN